MPHRRIRPAAANEAANGEATSHRSPAGCKELIRATLPGHATIYGFEPQATRQRRCGREVSPMIFTTAYQPSFTDSHRLCSLTRHDRDIGTQHRTRQRSSSTPPKHHSRERGTHLSARVADPKGTMDCKRQWNDSLMISMTCIASDGRTAPRRAAWRAVAAKFLGRMDRALEKPRPPHLSPQKKKLVRVT